LEEVAEVGAIAPNSIVNADCLEAMKFIPDKSIDCIICDLPYGITACKWDTVIPFEPLWEQYKRIIKPNGAIVLFGSQPFTSALVMSNPKWFKYEWIWEKNYGSNFASYKYMPSKEHENILVFGKSKVNYYPIRIPRSEASLKRDPKGTTRLKSNKIWSKKPSQLTGMTQLPIKSPYDIDGMRNPRTIVKFNKERIKEQNRHPTQKPVALLEYLIKTYTVEGELILDNTAGSGSLAIAAINTKRNYICIEKDDDYFQVMSDRIANHDPIAPAKKPRLERVPKGQLQLF
jgi:site-specific DNA-methyltransferase (adenine-specific)